MIKISKSLFDDYFYYQYRYEFSKLELYQEVKGLNVCSKKPQIRYDLEVLLKDEVEKIKNVIKNQLLLNVENPSFQIDEKISFQLTIHTSPKTYKSKIIKTNHWIRLFYYFLFEFIDFPIFSIWMNQHPLSKELKLMDFHVNHIDQYGKLYKNPIVRANDHESFWKITIPPQIIDQIFYYPILPENIKDIEFELKKDKHSYLGKEKPVYQVSIYKDMDNPDEKIDLFECFSIFFSQPLFYLDSWIDSENVIDLSK